MFISNKEKEQMRESITFLLGETAKLKTDILFLSAKIKVLEGEKKPKKILTTAQRAKQREYMRKYTARKRAEKLAQATA